MTAPSPLWDHALRRDGLKITRAADTGGWVICTGDDRPDIEVCPCCNKLFLTPLAAMVTADKLYPPAPQ